MAEALAIPRDGLASRSALDGFDHRAGEVHAYQIEPSILALAVPLGGDDAFAAALHGACGVERPETGRALHAPDGRWIAAVQADQLWLIETQGADALPAAPAKLTDAAYATEQSDAWAAIRIEGPSESGGVRDVLARLCMLDLHPDAFPVGTITRTLMEHMGVVILREEDSGGASRFLLLAARSYAGSFGHAVETCMNNAAPRQT